ncbi:MAG: D-aminoacylase [Actinomycetota bacterium]|nr:D-aminoacylase [Actinomycetota bacterium]
MFDLWIAHAIVVDGTGAPAYRASVGIERGRVALIARGTSNHHEPVAATTAIEADELPLTPGFVDVHTHSDMAPFVVPTMPSTIRQGVTTVVVGNCGASPFPATSAGELASWAGGDRECLDDLRFDSFAGFLARIEAARPAVNVAALIGHGSVRELTMGLDRRAPSGDELDSMRRLVADAMDAGAVGLSTGLIYVPGMYSGTDEIVALAQEAARTGGIYASHIRGEGSHLFRSVDEAIEIGRRAALPVHVSHLKCESSNAWGRAHELLERVHGAIDATGDQYPYAAWSSVLGSLLPEWAPVSELAGVLRDHAARARLIASVEHGEGDAFQSSVDGVGWDRIVIEDTADRSCSGLSITAVASRRGLEPVDAFFELLTEAPDTSCIGHAMHDDDVRTIMADLDVMVASDSAAVAPDGPMADVPVHPRTYGTFPRVVGPVVREGVLTLEAAVRKMTSLPADRFGLAGRGRIVEGAFADLVLFDPATIADRATFGHSHAFPDGFEAVIVNGVIAWRAGNASIERAGRVLRRGDP